jgi:hypothetical protein
MAATLGPKSDERYWNILPRAMRNADSNAGTRLSHKRLRRRTN